MLVSEHSINAGTEANPSASFTDDYYDADLPVLALPQSAYGGTGYLDSLKACDMDAPVMKGVDCHGRPFIAVRAKRTLLKVNGMHLVPDLGRKYGVVDGVEVYFQRYSNSEDIWCSGGPLGLMRSNMCADDKAFLRELIDCGQTVIVRKINMDGDLRYNLVELQ